MKKILMLALVLSLLPVLAFAQSVEKLTAKEIVAKADKKLRGETSTAELKMTIVRPTWSREITMKSWSKGDENSLILITAPARDKGAAFLKRGKELWNWQPSIDRTIKLPPSMMMQSWMGSDFKNDDLVRESSILKDYDHQLLGTETIAGYETYKIELIPKPEAPVVWGKIILWIDQKEFMQLQTEFYDEDDFLVNTMIGKDVKELGGKVLPAVLEVIPADEEGHKTRVEYLNLTFDKPIGDNFFSIQNMKRIR